MAVEFISKKTIAPKNILFKGARIVDPASEYDAVGDLLVKDGKIVDFSNNIAVAEGSCEIVDCKGLVLAPGLVDIQVHFRDPGVTSKEDLATGSMAAVSGGVTSVVCQPNTKPVIDNVMVLDYIKNKAENEALCNVYVYAAITKNMEGKEISEMGTLYDREEVVGFTDDGLPVMNAHIMRRAFEYAGNFGAVIAQHAEDLDISNGGCMNAGKFSEKMGVPGILNISESVIVARDIEILRAVGGKYHVLHVSARESLEYIKRGKEDGLNVTCEVTPHHFSLTDEAVLGYNSNAKMNPPLRSEEDKEALIAAIKSGLIDAIATDHAPHEKSSKDQPLVKAPFGIIGLETMLPISLELHFRYGLSLAKVLGLLTYKPAAVINVQKGRIKKGADADLCLIDLNKEWEISEQDIFSKSKNTPFIGRKVRGQVTQTYVAGKKVFSRKND